MEKRRPIIKRFIFHFPRLATLFLIFVLVVYAFGENDKLHYEYIKLVSAIVRKLITPTIMLMIYFVAVRFYILGGLLFIAYGIIYFIFNWDPYYMEYIYLVGTYQFVAGILFILNYERPMDTYD